MPETPKNAAQRKLLTFSLPHGEKKHELKFMFDLARGNHKTVYGYLSSGQLYEPDLSCFFRRVLKEGDNAIDIGANLGFHSVLMSKLVGATGSIEAFEPDPTNIRDFKANIALNHIKNIAVHEVALASSKSTVKLYSSKIDGGWNAVLTGATSEFVASIDPAHCDLLDNIASDTLDAACSGRKYKIAKIDVEGYEGVVLDGAKEILRSGLCDYWVVEYAAHCLAHFNEDQWSIRKRFYEHGYECFVMSRLQTFPMFVPRETTIVVPTIINLLFAKPAQLAADFTSVDFGAFVFGQRG